MLTTLSARFRVLSRVFLTALSTAFLITSAAIFSAAPVTLSAASPSPARHPSNTVRTMAYQAVASLYDAHQWHLLHVEHLAHLSYLQQLAAQPAPVQQAAYHAPARHEADAVTYSGDVSTAGDGSFQACVISRESGGNPDAQNPASTASGLYGFLSTTWEDVTGLPGPARDYSEAQQTAAFWKLYAEAGTSPWGPSDGC